MKFKAKLIASLKIWMVIYPSITLFLYFFGDSMSVMPLYQRTFVLTVSLVPWIVFVGIPLLDSILTAISTIRKKLKKQVIGTAAVNERVKLNN
jgi:antibiotic biosynthesis monooxygenase (ABM) superfamily enzyme